MTITYMFYSLNCELFTLNQRTIMFLIESCFLQSILLCGKDEHLEAEN